MILFVETIETTAYYIDPGTGSLVVQALIGLGVGALFALKMQWRRIKSALSRRGTRRDEHEADDV